MLFIGGISDKKSQLRVFNNVICSCGSFTSAKLVIYYSYFHLFFLPIAKWNKRYYVISRCCGPFECSSEYAKEIINGGVLDFTRLRKCEPRVYYDL